MRITSGAIFAAIGFAILSSSALAQGTVGAFVEGEILVKFKPGYESVRPLVHTAQKSRVKETIPKIHFELVQLAPGTSVQAGIARYRSYPYVEVAEPNYIRYKRLIPNDPMFGQQYGAIRMRLPQAWDVTTGDPTAVVAIIDDGVDIGHPDLAPNVVHGKDLVDDDNDPTPTPGNSHGTHCAGIAAAAANNGVGVAGMGFNCGLMGIRFNFTSSQSATGMIYAVDNGADVISMSYGGYGPAPSVEAAAVDYVWAQGGIMVSAAGNANYGGIDSWPDGFPKVISVGSTGPSDTKSSFSDFGPRVDVAGPGENIQSTYPNNTYGLSTGTSMSGPGVAGVVGLLVSHGGGAVTNAEVRNALESTCKPVGTWLNFGLVQADAALALIRPTIDVDVDAGSVSVMEGKHSGGDMASLENSDNNHYKIATANVARVGAVGSAVVEFDLPFDINDLRDSTLVLEAAGVRLATNFLYLWNWTTSRWVSVKQFPLNSSDTTYRHEMGTTIRNYVQNGKFRILTRGQMSPRRGGLVTPFKIGRASCRERV